jgi:hypothetical protein
MAKNNNDNAGKDAMNGVSTDADTTARQLMATHRVTAIWHSADGHWFTDKNAAMAHDAQSQCFTLDTPAQ